jgi:hypothetical protein
MLRSILDENPVSKVGTGLFTIAARQALAMGLGKHRDQLPSLEIDPLIDGFVTNGDQMTLAAKAPCDLLGRPASPDVCSHILLQER